MPTRPLLVRLVLAAGCTMSVAASTLLLAVPAQAATCDWTGNLDTNWSTSGNWSCGKVPGLGDDVSVFGEVDLDVAASVRTLTLGPGGIISGPISSSQALTVNQGITWTGGDIAATVFAKGAVTASGPDDKSISTGLLMQSSGTYLAFSLQEGSVIVHSGTIQFTYVQLSEGTSIVGTVCCNRPGANNVLGQVSALGDAKIKGLPFRTWNLEADPGATLSISGGLIWDALSGSGGLLIQSGEVGRVITGAPPEDGAPPEPTEVLLTGDRVHIWGGTWEHMSGEIRAEDDSTQTFDVIGGGTFVWSGGELAVGLAFPPKSSTNSYGPIAVALLGTSGEPLSLTKRPKTRGGLTLGTEMTIAGETEVEMAPGTSITIRSGGIATQYPGTEVRGTACCSNPATIDNSGTWSTEGGQDPTTIDSVQIKGAGTWDVGDGILNIGGSAPTRLGGFSVGVTSSGSGTLMALSGTVTIDKFNVTTETGYSPQIGASIQVVSADVINTQAMQVGSLAINPTLAYLLNTSKTAMTITPARAVPLTLNCGSGCPSTTKKNVRWSIPWEVSGGTKQASMNNVVLTVSLPRGTTYLSATGSTCRASGSTVTCRVGTVQLGTPISVAMRLKSATTGAIRVTGTLSGSSPISDNTKATKTVAVQVTN